MTALNRVSDLLRARPLVAERQRSVPELQARLQHKETLLQEVHHRVGNSLQIIASLLALDARKVRSEEARRHLVKAHRRILAVATVQRQFQSLRESGDLEFGAYLHRLGENLSASVVGDATRIAIEVRADAGTVSSAVAMKMGLIVTELVMNAVKHGFVGETATGVIVVTYRLEDHGWKLTVSDNGVGKPNGPRSPAEAGLGTGIVASLVGQLDGRIETRRGLDGLGTAVSITGCRASPAHSAEERKSWIRTGF